MNLSIATTHPSDLFNQAVNVITADIMARAIGCQKTHVYKQAANPNTNGDARVSLIEKIERMLTAIMEKKPVVAQTIVDRFCRICGGRFVANTSIRADKKTLAEELLDNIPAFSAYTETMQNKSATLEERVAAKLALINELEQDFDERLK